MFKGRARTPTVIQMEAVECGAAALGIVLGYYGQHVSLEELRVSCGVSRDGVNAFNIIRAAESYNLSGKGYEVDAKNINEVHTPAILYWENNHFVVLEGVKKDRVYINDPATGPRVIHFDDFKRQFSRVVLEFERKPNFQKKAFPSTILDAIKKRVAPFYGSLIFLFFVQICVVILSLAMPIFTQIFIDKILGESVFSWTWPFLSLLVAIMFLTAFVNLVKGTFLNGLQIKLTTYFSADFLWHVLKLPMQFFSQRYGGEVINRMALNNSIANTLSSQVVLTAINLILIIGYGLIIFQYDVYIAIIGIVTAAFNLILLYTFKRRRRNAYARIQQEQAKTIGISLDALQNMETIKITSNDNFFFSRIAEHYTKNINALQDIGKKDAWLFTLSNLSQQLSNVLLLGIGTWRVITGHLTIGMLIGLQILLSYFLKPFYELVQFGTSLQTMRIDLNRIDDVLKNPTDPILDDFSKTSSLSFQGNLEFKDVCFGYNPLAPPIIDNFNFSIKKGQWVALAGGIGSGKTTLSKLTCCLYHPWKGEVLYDGRLQKEYTRENLMHSIACVDQEIFLFSGTIKDNLTMWNSTIPEEEIVKAAKDACIHQDVMARSEGYNSVLLEAGVNFSAGQKQRLEIARALLLNPSLLVLDEATSALDSETEEQVMTNIRKRGCSCLFIAHRLSTLRFCDHIIVLEKGKMIQQGTHETLKRTPGYYQILVRSEEKLYG